MYSIGYVSPKPREISLLTNTYIYTHILIFNKNSLIVPIEVKLAFFI